LHFILQFFQLCIEFFQFIPGAGNGIMIFVIVFQLLSCGHWKRFLVMQVFNFILQEKIPGWSGC
jgi:hypothetical protein